MTLRHLSEYIIFALYVFAGPVMAGFFGFVLIKGRKRMMLLQRRPLALPTAPPHVTLVIPAKDEAHQIRDCLRAALAQDYPDFDVIAVNDRSTDGTGQIMDAMASADGRLTVLHIDSDGPPPGWTGKCHALHTAIAQTTGQWLLFVDSDVVLRPNALSATLAFALHEHVDLLSLLPTQVCRSFPERLMIPLAGCALGTMYLVALTNNDHLPHTAFANGQYMLFRRRAYDAIGGHTAVRSQLCEDIAFARLVKANGHRVRICVGGDLADVRMYDSLRAIRAGFARIYFAAGLGRPWRILAAMGFVPLFCYSAYAATGWGTWRSMHPINPFSGWGWLSAAVIHLSLMTVLLAVAYRWTGNRGRYALLLPLGAGLLLGILAKSLTICLTGRVHWRGTQYTRERQHDLVAP